MALVIDEFELKKLGLDEAGFRIKVATHFYAIGKVSMGQAAKFAELYRISFQKELSKREIDFRFSIKDLHHDVELLKSLSF